MAEMGREADRPFFPESGFSGGQGCRLRIEVTRFKIPKVPCIMNP